jgi:hypothetical protein
MMTFNEKGKKTGKVVLKILSKQNRTLRGRSTQQNLK